MVLVPGSQCLHVQYGQARLVCIHDRHPLTRTHCTDMYALKKWSRVRPEESLAHLMECPDRMVSHLAASAVVLSESSENMELALTTMKRNASSSLSFCIVTCHFSYDMLSLSVPPDESVEYMLFELPLDGVFHLLTTNDPRLAESGLEILTLFMRNEAVGGVISLSFFLPLLTHTAHIF